jgi:hypothetical protein
MAKNSKANDNISYVQKLCSEETWSTVEDPRFTTFRRGQENTERMQRAEIGQLIRSDN